jgi:2-polyprenyl-6-methoxyphenol hydroxylase-like FAD-dependent oxidoreductase
MLRTVLVSGAGVAGATLAYWLARAGYQVTVVERSAGQRSSGNPVDVRGQAVDIAERMGVLPRLREAASDVSHLTFVDARGRRVARVPMSAFQGGAGDREVEVPRADLAATLLDAGRDGAEFLWDDTVTELAQDPDGADVAFAHAPPRRFDLVLGADGLHSAVRRLAFGPEDGFIRHMGMYVATLRVDEPYGPPREVVLYNTPGRAVTVHPAGGRAIAAFMFRRAAVPDFDHRDTDRHRRLIAEAYPDRGWRLPDLLERVRTSDDLYFDAVSQVRMPRWSAGRVALVGDAASCLSLFGDGSTLAMTGAHTLAAALADRSGDCAPDLAAAFARYESEHRAVVAPKLNGYRSASALLLPASRAGIVARNAAVRTLPIVSRLRRR